jgi:methionyl-tRNA formyltransferase
MAKNSVVFLMPGFLAKRAESLASECGLDLRVTSVDQLADLAQAFREPRAFLLSFGTGVIVPQWIIESAPCLNIHAASPSFPGRDPHHFAVYDGAREYGSTLHYMTTDIDQGPIVDVELFPVMNGATPSELLEQANESAFTLMKRFFTSFRESGIPKSRTDIRWADVVRKRKDFAELCRVWPDMDANEFNRRLKATAMPGYSNLYIEVNGHRFRLEHK